MKLQFLKACSLVFIALIGSTFIACNDDDDNTTTTQNIIEVLSADANYTSLVAAIEAAGLTQTLSGTTQYTLFAPDNEAFAAFLTANGFNSLTDVPTDLLTAVLLNHVITGEFLSTSLSTGYVNTNSLYDAQNGNGQTGEFLSMYINTSSGVVINGGSANGGTTVETANVDAVNGVIHQIGNVIGLPTVVTFAVVDPNFSTLEEALTTATPATNFAQTLSGTGSFTVFAPTNDAFTALLATNDAWNSLSDIGEATLTDVLLYHVTDAGNIRSTDLNLPSSTTVNTLLPNLTGSETFQIIETSTNNVVADIDDSGTDINKNITVADVQASNGVIHVLNGVLLPVL